MNDSVAIEVEVPLINAILSTCTTAAVTSAFFSVYNSAGLTTLVEKKREGNPWRNMFSTTKYGLKSFALKTRIDLLSYSLSLFRLWWKFLGYPICSFDRWKWSQKSLLKPPEPERFLPSSSSSSSGWNHTMELSKFSAFPIGLI